MYLKILQKVAALVAFQNRPKRSAVKKVSLNSSKNKFQNEKLPFTHKKKTELSFELSQ